MTTKLMIVRDTPATRAATLMRDARIAANEDMAEVIRMANELGERLCAVAGGGDAYPIGIRDDARRWAAEVAVHIDRVTALKGRE